MVLSPVSVPTTDAKLISLVNQINLMKDAINKYTATNDVLVGTLQDESMSSSVLCVDKNFEFVCDKNGELVRTK